MAKKIIHIRVPPFFSMFFMKKVSESFHEKFNDLDLRYKQYDQNHSIHDSTGIDAIVCFDQIVQKIDHRPYNIEVIHYYDYGVFAHQDYLEKEGVPESFKDCEEHDFILRMDEIRPYLEHYYWAQLFHVPPTLGLLYMRERYKDILELLFAGKGLCVASSMITKVNPDLRRVMPNICRSDTHHIYFGARRKLPKHLQEPIEFIKAALAKMLNGDEI
jgi:DNA-binding transcriptional LysR family regulator